MSIPWGTCVSGSDIFCTARVKFFPGGLADVLVCDRAIFGGSGWEDTHGRKVKAGKGEGHDVQRAVRRARAQVREIALCTSFRWFVTLTLDRARIDRYDMAQITRHLNHWLDNQVRRKGLAYVLVPERHKDGAVHFHGFFNDALEAVDSGTLSLPGGGKPKKPRSAAQRAEWLALGAHPVYNLPGWSWGFTTAIELYGEYDKAVSYVCKYIGKDLAPSPNGDGLEPQKIGGRWYYSGGALGRPQVRYTDLDLRDVAGMPGAYRFDLPQAGLSFVQFQVRGGEIGAKLGGYVPGCAADMPLVGFVPEPPVLGLRSGHQGPQNQSRQGSGPGPATAREGAKPG